MKIKLIADASIHIANADGLAIYEGKSGDVLDVPADIAVMFIEQGHAEPVAAEKATKSAGKTATK